MTDVFAPATEGEGTPSPLTELVGEDKKFKTVEDLAKGKQESDAFIVKLQEENKEALDELSRLQGKQEDGKTVSELLAAIKESKEASKEGEPALTKDDLEKLVRDINAGDSAEATAKANREEGNKLVLEKVGGDQEAAKTYLADRATALNMSVDQLRSLSESSPAAFAELVGIKRTASSSQKGIGDIKSATDGEFLPVGLPMEVDGHNTKAYYDKLRKDMGVQKFLGDHKLQNRYLRDAMALGEEKFNPKS